LNDPRLLLMSSFPVDYPFADRLYPGVLDVIAHLRRWGPTVILTNALSQRYRQAMRRAKGGIHD